MRPPPESQIGTTVLFHPALPALVEGRPRLPFVPPGPKLEVCVERNDDDVKSLIGYVCNIICRHWGSSLVLVSPKNKCSRRDKTGDDDENI